MKKKTVKVYLESLLKHSALILLILKCLQFKLIGNSCVEVIICIRLWKVQLPAAFIFSLQIIIIYSESIFWGQEAN